MPVKASFTKLKAFFEICLFEWNFWLEIVKIFPFDNMKIKQLDKHFTSMLSLWFCIYLKWYINLLYCLHIIQTSALDASRPVLLEYLSHEKCWLSVPVPYWKDFSHQSPRQLGISRVVCVQHPWPGNALRRAHGVTRGLVVVGVGRSSVWAWSSSIGSLVASVPSFLQAPRL